MAMAPCMTSILLVYLSVIINGTFATKVCNSTSENWQSRIGVLISPVLSKSSIREIEIYWNNVNVTTGDKISLYEVDSTGTQRVLYTVNPNSPNGRQKTGVQADYVPSSNYSFEQECTKYGVLWETDDGIKTTECFKTRPNWMRDRKDILGPLTMSQIFLPGTHNSAIYDENGKSSSIISGLAVTQDLDILGQLIHGVRYLDIRVAHYPNTDELWWTNHGPFYRSVSLQTVIDQVKTFLDYTEEIVIMDFREFPIGFTSFSDHIAFMSYLEHELGDYYLINHGWSCKLNDIWSSGRRLIMGYEDQRVVAKYASVWPCVRHKWGNVNTIEDLYSYLNKVECDYRDPSWTPQAAMAELTANFNNILFNKFGDLRDMAYMVNLNVTNWYSTIWQNTANIVAVDFVRSTDIVEVAIKSNENRFSPRLQ